MEPVVWRDDHPDEAGHTCPVLLSTQWRDVFLAFQFLDHHMLPFPGGWAQQHAALIEAFEILASQQRRIANERSANAQHEE